MKKIIVCTLLSLISISTLRSQKSAEADEQVVKQGDNTINLYYGTNLLGSVYKRVASSAAENFKIRSRGPIGLVYEHLVTDIVGLGAEFGYSQTTVGYQDRDYYYDQNGQRIDQVYNYDWKFTTIRIMFRANFHFARTENFDAYALVSAGYRGVSASFTTDNPDGNATLSYNSPFVMGVKPGIGLRYFFVPNVGVNLEIAAFIPLMCGGFVFKF